MGKEKTLPQIKVKKKRKSASNSFRQALNYHLAGDLANAELHYRMLLKDIPTHPDAQYYLGTLIAQRGEIDAAKTWFKKVVHENTGQAQYWLTYAESHLLTGQPGEALAALAQAKTYGIEGEAFEFLREKADITLNQQPDLAEVTHLVSQGQLDEAIALIENQIKVLGLRVEFLRPMAEILISQGLFEKALPYAKTLSVRLPEDWQSWNIYGLVLKKLESFKEAYPCFERALELNPGEPVVVINSAWNFIGVRLYDKAIERIQPLAAAQPSLIDPRLILANALVGLQRLDEGRPLVEALVQEGHNFEALYLARARLHQYDGDLNSVIDVLEKGKDYFPKLSALLAVFRVYDPLSTPSMVKEEAMLFGDWLAQQTSSVFQQWQLPAKGERLRVGFVSADFGPHSVTRYLIPSLAHLSEQGIELFAYSNHERPDNDPTKVKLKALFEHWASIQGVSDAHAAQMIHDDRINILIDLGGHTKGNRLIMFQRRPAPVQATWIGFPSTTGVKNIDYILGSSYLNPPDEAVHFTEKVWRIPGGLSACFTAPDTDVQVNALPALTSQYFTFGSFNNPVKINDQTIAVWSKILHRMPHARLLLKVVGVNGAGNTYIERTKNIFLDYGVSAERLIFEYYDVPREEYMASHQQVDIALDPFPFTGATTSLESLWMGVPVLTLRGYNMASHVGEAIAGTVGLPEWIANDQEDYIERACRFAVDLETLAALRSNLRAQLLASPMCNSPLFAENFGKSLWAMWQQYLDSSEQIQLQN